MMEMRNRLEDMLLIADGVPENLSAASGKEMQEVEKRVGGTIQ
jgi:hypothetical protein